MTLEVSILISPYEMGLAVIYYCDFYPLHNFAFFVSLETTLWKDSLLRPKLTLFPIAGQDPNFFNTIAYLITFINFCLLSFHF